MAPAEIPQTARIASRPGEGSGPMVRAVARPSRHRPGRHRGDRRQDGRREPHRVRLRARHDPAGDQCSGGHRPRADGGRRRSRRPLRCPQPGSAGRASRRGSGPRRRGKAAFGRAPISGRSDTTRVPIEARPASAPRTAEVSATAAAAPKAAASSCDGLAGSASRPASRHVTTTRSGRSDPQSPRGGRAPAALPPPVRGRRSRRAPAPRSTPRARSCRARGGRSRRP